MKYKLLTSSVLEAIAELTGGDAPISMFLGQLSNDAARIERHLPKGGPPPEHLTERIAAVREFLIVGRGSTTSFDIAVCRLPQNHRTNRAAGVADGVVRVKLCAHRGGGGPAV